MEDREIIALFFDRSEQALAELSTKYEYAALHVGMNVLHNEEDVKECLNDAYLAVWNCIPPQSPQDLYSFFCSVMRNLCLTRYHRARAQKRDGGGILPLEEIEAIIPADTNVDTLIEEKELTALIDAWLGKLDRVNRYVFVRRFWYMDDISEISAQTSISPPALYRRIDRLRLKLAGYLEKNGAFIGKGAKNE